MKGKDSLKDKGCPDNFKKMCEALNAWATEWENWGKAVKAKVDPCCADGPGGLPTPPKPPF
jgi:hypothetical protein